MASLLPELSRAFQRSGEGYSQKLNQYAQVFQNIKSSQVAKQQMQQELDRQMELIEFRSDVELDRQKQYFEEVEKPQLQYERQQEQIQQIQQSYENATEQVNTLAKEFYTKYDDVATYNLFQPNFKPTLNEDGSYDAAITLRIEEGEQRLSEQQYRRLLEERADAAQFLRDLEQNKQDLGESEMTAEGRKIGRDNVDSFIRSVKFNPQKRQQFLQEYSARAIDVAAAEETVEEGTKQESQLYSFLGKWKTLFEDRPVAEFTLKQQDGWFFEGETGSLTINAAEPISTMRSKIETFFSNFGGVDISVMEQINEETRSQILAGNASGIEDENLTELADFFSGLAEDRAGQLQDILTIYSQAPKAWQLYNQETGGRGGTIRSLQNSVPNLWYGSDDSIGNAFISAQDPNVQAFQQLYSTGQQLRQ